jgi:hypothetical protein
MLLYLASAEIVNTELSAFLAFCDRPVYSYYLRQPNPFQISPMTDQIVGASSCGLSARWSFWCPLS